MEYHVQKGDTIMDVTRKLQTNWKTLRVNNPQSIGRAKNGNWFLKEGSTLTTEGSFVNTLQQVQATKDEPHSNVAQSISKEAPSPSNSSASREIIHTIKAGETLWELAVKKYHVTVEDLMKENNIKDPRRLQIGQKLTIPLPEEEEKKIADTQEATLQTTKRSCLKISRGDEYVTISPVACRY